MLTIISSQDVGTSSQLTNLEATAGGDQNIYSVASSSPSSIIPVSIHHMQTSAKWVYASLSQNMHS